MAFSFPRARGMSMPPIPSYRNLTSPASSPTKSSADTQPTSPSRLRWASIDLTEEEDEDEDLHSRSSSFHSPATSFISTPNSSPFSGTFKMSPPDKIVSSASQYDAVDPLDDLGEALDHQLTLDSDLPNVDQLPSDVFRLQEMIRDSRAVIERRNRSLLASKDRLEKLSRSHDELLERSALWKDELETLQASHADVQQQLGSSIADNERLGEQIKDLRHTSEESRRAILRLQGERKSATGGVAGDRRSVAAGSLAGWNPSMLGGEPSGSGSTPDDGGRSSKRSTILFGAPTAASRRHTRSGSGVGVTPSSSQTDSQNDVERTPQQASSGGLRGLRLGFDRPSEADGDETVGEESSTRRPLSRRSLLLPPSGNANRPPSTSSVSPTPSASGSGLGSPIMDGQFLPLPSSPALSASEGGDVSTARASTQTFSTAGAAGMSAMQIMRLKDDELAKMQAEMKTLRGKLDEAIEGRRASDACLKALKEFIGEGGPEGGEEARAALRGVKLPPLPTDGEEEEGGAKSGQNGSVTDNWWSSVMRKASSATPAATNPKRVGSTATTAPSVTSASGPSSDLLSTSPSNQSNTSASGRSWGAAEASSPIPSSSGVVGGSSAGGLASFGSFFARSTSSSSSSPQPPNPPSKSPENLRPIDHRSYSTSSGTSDVSGGSAAGAEGVNGSPRRPANAALNRLSNWFSKPAAPTTAAEDSHSTLTRVPSVASPPFASLEESTLQRVDLSATPRKSSGGPSDVMASGGSSNGVGLGLVGAGRGALTSPSPSGEAALPLHKEVPLNAKAAKADSRSSDVGEDGGLMEGPLVAPSFD